MKILHTADWHIGQFKGPVVDGVNLRSQDTVKCLEYMVQVAIEEKPDIVCVSGDIFHQEQVGPVRYSDEMITATNIITSLAHFSKYVIVMRGTPNHDGAAQFRVLERMLLNIRNVDVVTEPGVIKTPWADIACLPGFDKQEFRAKFPGLSADEENLAWTKYISDMVFALRAECEKTPILMAHYTVPGCNMESGQTSFFTNFEPVIPREALMAARYEAVLLGHIHRPQIIEGLDNVFYSGAINAMNFNDEGQDRGFWIHEFNEKGTLVKGHKCTTPYRQFHTITWDPDEAGDYIREGAMYLHRTGISERYYANKVWKRSRTHEAVDSGKLSGTHGDTAKTFYIGSKNSSIYFCLYEKEKEQKSKGIKTDIKNRFEIRLKSGKAEQTIEQLVFSRNPEQTIASLILTQIDFPVYILWDIFLDNVTTSLPFIMTPVAVNMDKTKRWLERQVMPSLLMIKEIEKQTGANYLEEIDRHTRLTERQELKIKQMTTDIADMIEKDTAVPQGNDGIF